MEFPYVADPDKTGKDSGAFHGKMVVKHFDLNIRPHDAVFPVGNRVHNQLRPTELRIFGSRLKAITQATLISKEKSS